MSILSIESESGDTSFSGDEASVAGTINNLTEVPMVRGNLEQATNLLKKALVKCVLSSQQLVSCD